uniref:p-glycoprotein n=1 Tax=Anadara kagoshimensis TaxID=1390362 RepID=A0A0H3U629_9BIVA|nr:P-glycoprotein [Anadara sativa]
MMEEEKEPLLKEHVQEGLEPKSYTKEKTGKETEKKEPPKNAKFSDLFRYATCWDICLMIFGSLMAVVHGTGFPLLSLVFGEVTNTFINGPGGTNSNASAQPNMTIDEFNDQMTESALRYIYIGSGVFVATYLQIACWTSACERQIFKIRKKFFHSIMKQEISWFDNRQSGELTSRLADDLEKVKDGIGDKFSFVIQFASAFFSGFGVGFWKGWKMTLVMMSLTPLLAICASLMGKIMTEFTKKEQASYAGAGSIAEEVLSCIRTVISFNGQKQETKRYEKALLESRSLGIKKGNFNGFFIGLTYLVMFSTYALAFWYGSELVKDWYNSGFTDGLSPGDVIVIFFCVMIGSFSLGNAAPHLGSIFAAKGAGAVIFEIIDHEPSIDNMSTKGEHPNYINGNIDFVGVNFSYKAGTDEEVKAVQNLNLSVKQGKTVALVGSSGCGKSTIINLLQRFYDPINGQVYIDGKNIKDLNVGWLRRNIGVVSQEPVLFDCTISENIRLGNPDATEAQIRDAAKMANAHDFISNLPKGYDTMVGERGAQLSGGQKQRVAIARALVRDPKILLLDEATSALDSESEKIVQAALDKARLGRTTIVIAHRLSTIQSADEIHVMDRGEILEQGTHADLMERKKLYYELVTAQTLVEEELENDDDTEETRDRVSESEATDGEKGRAGSPFKRSRSRGISESSDKMGHKLSRQTSRQFSRQMSKKDELNEKKDEKDEEKETLEESEKPNFFRILKANKPEWPFIVMGLFGSAISGGTMPTFAIFFSEMINVFINQGKDSLLWSMMFLALGGANFLCTFIQMASFGQSSNRLTMRLRLQTFQAFLRQDVAYFDDHKHSTGAMTTRLATDGAMVQTATGYRISSVLQAIVGLIVALTIAFLYGWQLALVVLGGVPIVAAASGIQMKVITGKHKEDQAKLEDAGKVASESIENIRTVQSLHREIHFYNSYCQCLLKPYRSALQQAQLYAVSFAFSQGILFFIYGGAFRFGAWMVELDQMTPANVYKVFFAITFTGSVIGQASSFLPDYSKARVSAGLIFKILDRVPPIDVYSQKGIYLQDIQGRIRFKDVNFNYPNRPDVKVLQNFNLEVEPGQTVALVGPSGCGKSTVVSLLQRFYDPDSGQVMVDGGDIRDMHLQRFRSFIGVVGQEPVLFDCSIRDNIAYGLDTDVGMDEIIEAARMANIHEFIVNRPTGYDTEVGEKGTQLSGGQKQRIAIARALVRNPRILLLDEATSALDTESEKLVQEALDNVQQGRTCIVIAHRLSTIQNADVIYVIDNGQIVEIGTHQQLLAKRGVYSSLVSAQQFTKL